MHKIIRVTFRLYTIITEILFQHFKRCSFVAVLWKRLKVFHNKLLMPDFSFFLNKISLNKTFYLKKFSVSKERK